MLWRMFFVLFIIYWRIVSEIPFERNKWLTSNMKKGSIFFKGLDHSGYGFFKRPDHLQFHQKSMETAAAQHLCKIRRSRNLNSNGNYGIKRKITSCINSFASLLFLEKWFTKNSVLGSSILTRLADFVSHLFHFRGRAHCCYTTDLKVNPFFHLFFSQTLSVKT